MSEKSDHQLVGEILQAVERINKYIEGVNYNKFLNDAKTIDAVLMNLIVIGETANRLSEDFKDRHVEMDWFSIRGLRNRVAHDYIGTNLQIVWDTITSDIPELKAYIEKII